MAEAAKDFEHHRVEEVGQGHWRIRKPQASEFWCDIVVLGHNSAIMVWGDIAACVFAYCSGESDPLGVVRWMASADTDYGHQKAVIGMGDLDICEGYEPAVALHEIEDRIDDASCQFVDVLELAKDRVFDMDFQEWFFDEVQEFDPDAWEWVGSIGKVTSVRVIYALAAIRRLNELSSNP